MIPTDANIFTDNPLAMYTNVDLHTVMQAFETLFTTYEHIILPIFPKNSSLPPLKLVMENNIILSFGGTSWLQKSAAAMGTPATPYTR
jgi:hypothetical protein